MSIFNNPLPSRSPSPPPPIESQTEKRKREENQMESSKVACIGEGIFASSSASTQSCEALRDRAKTTDEESPIFTKKVKKAAEPVIADRLPETVSITIKDGEAVLTYEGSRANLCESKLFNLLLNTSFSTGGLILSLEEIDNQFNEGKGHSLEKVVKVLQFLFSGETAHLHEDSADQLSLLCSYLSLANFFQSDLLSEQGQKLFISNTEMENAPVEQWEAIANAAKLYKARQVMDEVLDCCIDYLGDMCFAENPVFAIEFSHDDPLLKIFKCRELIKKYGHLKRYLTVDLSSEDSRDKRQIQISKFYAKMCQHCCSLQRITMVTSSEDAETAIESFNEELVNALPHLKQLLNLKLAIISPGKNDVLRRLISAMNDHPALRKISLRFFPIDGTMEEYSSHVELLSSLSSHKLKSLILEADCIDLHQLSFMKELSLNKLIFKGLSFGDYKKQINANLREASTYPDLKELILKDPTEDFLQLARSLPFKKVTVISVEED